jgi:hypothetical protein
MMRHLVLLPHLSLSAVGSVLNRASQSRSSRRFCCSTQRIRDAPSVHPLRRCYEGAAQALDVTDELIPLGSNRVFLQKQPVLALWM